MDPVDPARAAQVAARLEPLHSLVYFVPETGEELAELGVTQQRSQYFGQRSAAMGAVGPGVVAATFYNFNPALIARSVPAVWTQASPADILNARLRAVDRALHQILGDAVSSAAVTEAATLARRATEGAGFEDRPLFAGHADLPWPDEPHLMLWHAATLLREHRGDAHLHALVSAGLSGIEALVTHTATGAGFAVEFAQRSRGWSPEQWGEAHERLVERGVLGADGALTTAGTALRADIEAHTSRMSVEPWNHLGERAAARLYEVATPLDALLGAGTFGGGAFAPGSERSRSSTTEAAR